MKQKKTRIGEKLKEALRKVGSKRPHGAEGPPPQRPTAQSIDDENRAAGEGMGQAKYGPPPTPQVRR